MASKINKVLTNQTQTLSNEELANVSASLSAILGQGSGGEQCASAWLPTITEDGDISWTLTSATIAPATANIMGPPGPTGQDGAPGSDGADGTSVVLQSVIDVEGGKQVTLAWGETPSTSSFVIPSGTPGTNGKDGKDGTDGTNGTSVHLDSVSTVAGGTQVTLGWGTSDTSAFVIPSGAAGAPGTNGKDGTDGEDGVSPTISATELGPTEQHPQGGFAVTITDKTGSQTINIWNGNNGAGATVRLLEGTGIKIEADGSDYTIGVSADYALKSELPDVTDMATKTWVSGQGYLTSIPDSYATKAYANEASANALSAAETWVNQQNFATSAGLAANKQFAMTTTGWKEIQGGGGGTTYTAGEGISIDNDVISFSGAQVAAQEYVLAGNGTVESPFNTSSFYENYLENLASINGDVAVVSAAIAAMGGAIKIIGNASCNYINNLQVGNINPGDSYILTDSDTIYAYNAEGQQVQLTAHAGDMAVLGIANYQKTVALLATTPNLTQYAKLNQRTIVKAGVGVTVSHAENSDGAVEYTVNTVGGGGEGTLSAYTVTCSGDNRFDFERSVDPITSAINYNMTTTMPNFINVTATPTGTLTPNSYYFVYEE